MECGIEKFAMLVMKSGKRHLTGGMKLPNHDKIRTLGEKETYKYLGILEVDTVKQVDMKEKIKKEYLRRTRNLLEIKLSSRNLIKGRHTWVVSLVRYWGPFLRGPEKNLSKWTKEQENLWPCIRHYIPETTLTDYMYQEDGRKRTYQHWRPRWGIDTTTRRIQRKIRSRTDYSHKKRDRQHDSQLNDNN